MDQYGFDSIKLYPEIGQPTWVELITVRADGDVRLLIHREIVDPADYAAVRNLVLAKATGTSGIYLRSMLDGSLEPVDRQHELTTGLSVVATLGNIPGGAVRVGNVLRSLPEIMPSRMIWPT